ncbi:MAG: gamma-glutamyltransferase [SAR202 cluster bacterium]|nr:gamma-glutamyltransferase [SAR202 cluster bacterium]
MDNKQSTMRITKTEARAPKAMVATKDKLATLAGLEILEAGGNAIDAAIAACLAVGVVEPTSAGIGGGGYLVYQVGGKGGTIGFPPRAPLAAKADMYKLTGESAVAWFGWPGVEGNANLEGPLSVGTPGTAAGLCEAHRRYGRIPLSEVVKPAVRLAREGFAPHWFNLYAIGLEAGKLGRYKDLRNAFLPGDEMPLGDLANPPRFKQPGLADTLEAMGKGGHDAFYKGDVGKAIVRDVQAQGGILTERDLAEYRPFVWEPGLEITYRGRTVRAAPFGAAGIVTAMTLKTLEGFDVNKLGHNSVDMLHAFICSTRLAYADRFEYMTDPEVADVPWNGMVSEAYLAKRRALIKDKAPARFEPGDPWVEEGRRPKTTFTASRPGYDDGTTHLCVIDGDGNAVSLTNTIGGGLGAGIVPKGTGIVMNAAMMWFDPRPGRLNSIRPGMWPLNNAAPAMVLDKGRAIVAVGATGGRRITNCVAQLIINTLDYGMGPQEAIDTPRVDCSSPETSVDPRLSQDVKRGLEKKGHKLREMTDEYPPTGFWPFASPAAIVRNSDGSLSGGVHTFHSAHAGGL